MTNIIRTVFLSSIILLLSACGGGGGSAGNTGGPQLFTTAAEKIVIAPREVQTYTIGGGSPAYLASSNSGAATAIVNGNKLVITGISTGTAIVTLRDASGGLISINVEITGTSNNALFTTAPSSLTLANNSSPITYSINGGTPPYSVTSSNPSVANAVLVGTAQFSIAGVAAGTAEVNVLDALGAPVKIFVTVVATTTNTEMNILPGDATGNVGDTLRFKVLGGIPNFSLLNNNPSIALVSPENIAVGGLFTAKLLNVGETDVTIIDAQGQTKKIKIKANAASTILRLSPASLTIAEDTKAEELKDAPILLSIYGGAPPYTAYTSDRNLTEVIIDGATLQIRAGNVNGFCIPQIDGTKSIIFTVVDSLGASATSTMTIKDNGKGGGGCN